jgi:hypothetical protein
LKTDDGSSWTNDLLDMHCNLPPETTEAAIAEDLKMVLYYCYGYSMEEQPYIGIAFRPPKELTWLKVCHRLSMPEVNNLSLDVIIPIKDFVTTLLKS